MKMLIILFFPQQFCHWNSITLKQKQEHLKNFVARRMARLKLAYPSMKSEKIIKLLNKRIDILEILKNDKK